MMIKEEAAEDISGGGRRLPRRTDVAAAGESALDGRRRRPARAQPRWKKVQEQQSKGGYTPAAAEGDEAR